MKKLGAWAIGIVMLAFAVGGTWVVVGNLVREWRSGAAFLRYKNWKGQPVSHADALILFALFVLAMILGMAYTAWDKRRERRIIEKIRREQGR